MKATTGTRARQDFDLLVVGAGVAGLYAALCAATEGRVLVLAKGPLRSSTSSLAQGGIAAALADDDTPALHAEDTLGTGRGVSRPTAVAALTGEAPARIRDLVELGVEFDDDLGLEGGHSRRRVVHAGGAATGDRIAKVLVERVLSHPNIEVADGERMEALWRWSDRCVGVVTDRRAVRARATLLATGGAAALWSRTTNPPGAVGDGIVAAYRAGAAVADLEFVQSTPRPSSTRRCSSLRRFAGRERFSSTSTASASPTSLLLATSLPATSRHAGQRFSTCARSTAGAFRA